MIDFNIQICIAPSVKRQIKNTSFSRPLWCVVLIDSITVVLRGTMKVIPDPSLTNMAIFGTRI